MSGDLGEVDGGFGDDGLETAGDNVRLFGDRGDDVLRATGSDALVSGGAGGDALFIGKDGFLKGGSGADVFVLGEQGCSEQATLVDFSADKDRLRLADFASGFEDIEIEVDKFQDGVRVSGDAGEFVLDRVQVSDLDETVFEVV